MECVWKKTSWQNCQPKPLFLRPVMQTKNTDGISNGFLLLKAQLKLWFVSDDDVRVQSPLLKWRCKMTEPAGGVVVISFHQKPSVNTCLFCFLNMQKHIRVAEFAGKTHALDTSASRIIDSFFCFCFFKCVKYRQTGGMTFPISSTFSLHTFVVQFQGVIRHGGKTWYCCCASYSTGCC